MNRSQLPHAGCGGVWSVPGVASAGPAIIPTVSTAQKNSAEPIRPVRVMTDIVARKNS